MIDTRTLQTKLGNAGFKMPVDGDLGPKTYAGLFAFVGRFVPTQPLPQVVIDLGAAADSLLDKAAINTPLRLSHALAQWATETGGFRTMEENLSYSAGRLMSLWPSKFRSTDQAAHFAGDPQATAERVYGGLYGNDKPGDGWRYRGRGPTMLTFANNYADASHLTGIDLNNAPEKVSDPSIGLAVAAAFWTARHINDAADANDIEHVRMLVNGGTNGLDDARRYFARARMVLV